MFLKYFRVTTIVFLIALFLPLLVIAQPSNKLVKDIVMPPPNAASLGMYSDVPVDLANGLPQIGVPIYTVQEGPLTHSISLSYHSSGIRLGQPASWVGLGWSLQGAGMISRTVQGLPDEDSNGFKNQGHRTMQDQTTVDYVTYINDVQSGLYDAEPDIFNFNTGTVSGKFFIDHTDTVRLIDGHTDVHIEHNYSSGGNQYESFVITAPNGVRYIFGKSGTNESYETMQAGVSTSPNRSTWMLVKIETHDQNYAIDFVYRQEAYQYRTLASGYREEGSNGFSTIFPGKNGTIGSNLHFIWQTVQGQQLDTIKYSTGKVAFHATTTRDDLTLLSSNNPKRLDAIKVYTGQTYCQEFNFTYDYYNDSSVSAPYAKRLRLLEVQEKSCDNTISKPPYNFDYVGTNSLPHRLSKAIDHWGFYNGETGNNSLEINIPATSIPHPIPGNTSTISYGTAQRESSETHMLQGTLEKVTFPTGGSAHFEMEANQINEWQITGVTNLISHLESCLSPNIACCGPRSNETTYTFTSQDQIDNAVFDLVGCVQYASDNTTRYDSCQTPFKEMKIEIYQGSTFIGDYTGIFSGEDFSIRRDLPLSEISTSLSTDVSYTFKVSSQNSTAKFTLKEETRAFVPVDIGGLRIKRLNIVDDAGHSPTVVKDYKYHQFDDPTRSSGILNQKPRYHLAGWWQNSTGSGNDYSVRFYESSKAPLTAYEGRHIIYRQVTEDLNGLGRNEYTYYNSPIDNSDIGSFNSFGGLHFNIIEEYNTETDSLEELLVLSYGQMSMDHIVPYTTNISRLHGKLSMKKSIAEDGTEIANELHLPGGYTKQIGISEGIRVTGFGQTNVWSAYHYPLKIGARVEGSVTSTVDGVESIHLFSYDPNWRFHSPKKTKTVNSNGDSTIMNYTYPAELIGSVYGEMVSRNIITQVATSKTVGGQLVDGSSVTYELFGGNRDPYPKYFYRKKITQDGIGGWTMSPDSLEGTIGNYLNGLPTSFTKDGGWDPENYEWTASGKIKKKTFKDFEWVYDYHPGTNLVYKITDIDGQFVEYTYDKLTRFKTSSTRGGNVTTQIDYSFLGQSGTNPENYVKNTTSFTAVTGSDLTTLTTFQYFDGLGRELQTVRQGYGPNSHDIASGVRYDQYGRSIAAYQPVNTQKQDGSYTNLLGIADTTTSEYYDDPLSRLKSTVPITWSTTQMDYGTNVSSITDPAGEVYPANTLRVEIVTDPNGNLTKSYQDLLGRAILIERLDNLGSVLTSTFTSYDLKGRVNTVFPPGATTSTPELIYTYKYDGEDKILEKKVPERVKEECFYDSRDLLTYKKHAAIPAAYQYLVSAFDDYGRVVETGFAVSKPSDNAATTSSIAAADMLSETFYGATGIALGKVDSTSIRVLDRDQLGIILGSKSFYDIHGRLDSIRSSHHENADYRAQVTQYAYDFADNVIEETYTQYWSESALSTISETGFDHSGRMVDQWHTLISDGVSGPRIHTGQTTYTAKDQIERQYLGATSGGFLQQVDYSYLSNGFLDKINNPTSLGNDLFGLSIGYNQAATNSNGTAQYNGNIASLVSATASGVHHTYGYDYDGLDRLKSADFYDYNDGSANDRYNSSYTYDALGNIQTLVRSGVKFDGQTPNYGVIDDLSYAYDTGNGRNNRLLNVGDAAPAPTNTAGYDPKSSANYTYDDNGNTTYNPSGDYNMSYNYLNLPYEFDLTENKVRYTYTANGMKLQELHMSDGGDTLLKRDYLGPVVYTNDSIQFVSHVNGRIVPAECDLTLAHSGVFFEQDTFKAGTIQSIATMEAASNITYQAGNYTELQPGFEVALGATFSVEPEPCASTGAWIYQYNLADHLGNSRILFADLNGDESVNEDEILQENHYYAFGMEMAGDWLNNTTSPEHRYRYNGIEHVEELGLDMAFYRSYDPAIGRWLQVDPKAESFASMSPYTGMGNNPISITDPLGDSLWVNFYGQEAQDMFLSLVNSGFEGQFEASVGDGGLISVSATEGGGDLSKLSEHGKAFYEEFLGIVENDGKTKVKIENGSFDVPVGLYKDSRIDIGDIMQFNNDVTQLGATSLGKLIHELVEQDHAQQGTGEVIDKSQSGWRSSHPWGVSAENCVNQSTRCNESNRSLTQEFHRGGRAVRTTYSYSGRFWGNKSIISVKNETIN